MQEEKLELLSSLAFTESPYIEATLAKDKILSMAASDASYNLQKLYKQLVDENKRFDSEEDEIPTEEELDK